MGGAMDLQRRAEGLLGFYREHPGFEKEAERMNGMLERMGNGPQEYEENEH